MMGPLILHRLFKIFNMKLYFIIVSFFIVSLLNAQAILPHALLINNNAYPSTITANTASWLTAVYQYDTQTSTMKIATNGGQIMGGAPTESNAITRKIFQNMDTWFKTLMGDTFT